MGGGGSHSFCFDTLHSKIGTLRGKMVDSLFFLLVNISVTFFLLSYPLTHAPHSSLLLSGSNDSNIIL